MGQRGRGEGPGRPGQPRPFHDDKALLVFRQRSRQQGISLTRDVRGIPVDAEPRRMHTQLSRADVPQGQRLPVLGS